jgi:AraC-like DNA-binding protein
VRVERATSLLTGTPGYSLTEIACLSGFTDLRRFRLVFRRLMGMPPAMYRQMHRDATTSVRGAFESFPSLGKASRLGIFQPALAPDLPA